MTNFILGFICGSVVIIIAFVIYKIKEAKAKAKSKIDNDCPW